MAKDNSAQSKKKNDTLRFTALDFFIIVLVIALIAGVFFRNKIADLFIDNVMSENTEIGFMVEAVDKELLALIPESDSVYWNGEYLGTMENITSEEAYKITETDLDGDKVLDKIALDGKCKIRGNIVVSGRHTDKGLYIGGGNYLTVGKMLEINGTGYTVNVIITEIDVK